MDEGGRIATEIAALFPPQLKKFDPKARWDTQFPKKSDQ